MSRAIAEALVTCPAASLIGEMDMDTSKTEPTFSHRIANDSPFGVESNSEWKPDRTRSSHGAFRRKILCCSFAICNLRTRRDLGAILRPRTRAGFAVVTLGGLINLSRFACDCVPSGQSQDGKGSLAETNYIGVDF